MMILMENFLGLALFLLINLMLGITADHLILDLQNPIKMIHCCFEHTFFLHFFYDNWLDHYKIDSKSFFPHMSISVSLFFRILHPKIWAFDWNKSFLMTMNLSKEKNFEETSSSSIFVRYWTSLLNWVETSYCLFTVFFGKSSCLSYLLGCQKNHLKTLLYC